MKNDHDRDELMKMIASLSLTGRLRLYIYYLHLVRLDRYQNFQKRWVLWQLSLDAKFRRLLACLQRG